MTPTLFHELIVFRMINDSTEQAMIVNLDIIDQWLDDQAKLLGYSDWIDAYHRM